MSTSVDVLREAIEEAAQAAFQRVLSSEREHAELVKATRLAALDWLVADRDNWKTLFLRENRARLDAEIGAE